MRPVLDQSSQPEEKKLRHLLLDSIIQPLFNVGFGLFSFLSFSGNFTRFTKKSFLTPLNVSSMFRDQNNLKKQNYHHHPRIIIKK